MNLQNGTLDTRLPQNIIRNFEIPTNVEHGALNPFKIGGGNAIWATYFPPNVKVWFSTTPNFDSAQRLDYMNRGMRFNAIGSDGIQQQYDNFYIFTEGTWDDVVKIAVSSQGDIVEPILSSNTGDIDSVGRVASILKMPVNGTIFNEPDFKLSIKNQIAANASFGGGAGCIKIEYDFLNFLQHKKYLFNIKAQVLPFKMYIGGGEAVKSFLSCVVSFGFLDTNKCVLTDGSSGSYVFNNMKIYYINQDSTLKTNYNFYELIINNIFYPISTFASGYVYNGNYTALTGFNNAQNIAVDGKNLYNKIPCVILDGQNSQWNGYFDFEIDIFNI